MERDYLKEIIGDRIRKRWYATCPRESPRESTKCHSSRKGYAALIYIIVLL